MQTPDLHLQEICSFGQDQGQGNMVGIQPFMAVADYATTVSFRAKLNGYLAAAQAEGWLNPRTIVIFPEYIGTWLVAVGESHSIFEAGKLETAVKQMILRHLPRFLINRLKAQSYDKVVDALFRMKAGPMAEVYYDTFSHLAQQYQVTIVAGSIILPQPALVNGRLQTGKGPLQNVSLVFDADGRPYPDIVRKVYMVQPDEASFTMAGAAADLPVFETPAGRLGVLICADSWYADVYEALAPKKPQLLAVPNNQAPAGCWHKPWPGYNPGPPPADVDLNDVGTLTEGEAWLKYGLGGRLAGAGAAAGMHVFFHGRLWDQSGDGHTIMVTKEGTTEAPHVEKAALTNLWLALS